MQYSRPEFPKEVIEFSNITLGLPSLLKVRNALQRLHRYAGVEPKLLLVTSPSHCGKTTALRHYMNKYNELALASNTDNEYTHIPLSLIHI